jgi:hypothetical protein
LRKLKQQWAELYCTDVGAGVKKDSGPYTFVYHAADRGEYRQGAGAFGQGLMLYCRGHKMTKSQ